MSNSRTRTKAIFLVFILLPAVISVIAVHASPTCERFVRTYVTRPVRNRVSKTTALAWAKWRVGHPDWKPNPNRHRPKYKMTRQESVDKIAFACTVPTIPSTLDIFFTPADFPGPPPFLPLESTQIALPSLSPPELAEIPPVEVPPYIPGDSFPPFAPFAPFAPFIPPVLGTTPAPTGGVPILPILPPPVVGPVPESSSLLLVALGLCSLGLWERRRFAQSRRIEARK